MAQLAWFDGEVWVALQQLDRGADLKNLVWKPTDYSSVAIVDPGTLTVRKEIRLRGKNPVSDFKMGPDGMVYIANRGGGSLGSGGGLERIDPVEETSLGIVLNEDQLGGAPFNFVFGAGHVWVLVQKSDYSTRLVRADLGVNGQFANWITLQETDSLNPLQDILYDSERRLLFVAQREVRSPGITIRNAETFAEVCFFSVGAPPQQILWKP
jgi:hypothetical protein